jgi:hypothetical protein
MLASRTPNLITPCSVFSVHPSLDAGKIRQKFLSQAAFCKRFQGYGLQKGFLELEHNYIEARKKAISAYTESTDLI